MTYYADDQLTLHRGDALAVLRTLPDESVQCVVTSPPYYGLRDYGTAEWRGGSENCDHMQSAVPRGAEDPGIRRSTLGGGKRTTTALLNATGLPWVMENVPEAPIRHDLLLCGSQFGLRVRRHRAFETSPRLFSLIAPCRHRDLLPFMHKGERAFADAMGCEWMTNREARQAIPPAFTEHIGEMLMAALTTAVAS